MTAPQPPAGYAAPPPKKGLGTGAIVGIAIGAVVLFCGGCGVFAIARGPVTTTTQVAAPAAPSSSADPTTEATPSTTAPSTTTTAAGPLYTVDEDTGLAITVMVTSADPDHLRTVFDQVKADVGGDSRQVFIDCTTGGAGTSANRLAVGAYATTSRGLTQTGLGSVDEVRFTVNEGRTCP